MTAPALSPDHQVTVDWWTTEAMIRRGGDFVQALGRAARRADADNLARLKRAFPEFWARYEALGAEAAFRVEVDR